MATIVARRPVARALKAFRDGFSALMLNAASRIGAEVVRAAGPDGIVQPREAEVIAQRAATILRDVFVDSHGQAVLPDGTPVSPYARMLLGACAWLTREQVRKHGTWMRDWLPDDVRRWLERPGRAAKEAQAARRTILTLVRRGQEETDLVIAARAAKIVAQNPLAQYDAPHLWVDPKGYTLNERIWRAETEIRTRLNALLRDEINAGTGALQLSRRLEQFLVPGRAVLRTGKPYGTDASYYAMRLARTEIAHAGNSASRAASRMNPYVSGIDIRRSGAGDPDCPTCPQFVTFDTGGSRIRDPYPVESAPAAPFHPHCMCYEISVVSDTPEAVADALRAQMEAGAFPATTPVLADQFTSELLGAGLSRLLGQIAQIIDLPM